MQNYTIEKVSGYIYLCHMQTARANVLVAPLDWGLGHATRCIPVIDQLLLNGCQVILGGSGIGLDLLRERYPVLDHEVLPSYNITYPRKGSMALHMVMQMPKIFRVIGKENQLLDDIISRRNITHVISDNRYGLHSKRIPSVIMTHQVHVSSGTKIKSIDQLLFLLHRNKLEKFDMVWIVDHSHDDRLAGDLSSSNGLRIPFQYTGMLSRFTNIPNNINDEKQPRYSKVAILSGPEPQRSLLEEKMKSFFIQSKERCLIVRGTGGKAKESSTYVDIFDSINDGSLLSVLHPETTLYCRPGYSTLMDLAYIKHHKVFFIPTPGQTEQEYLGMMMMDRFGYTCSNQESFFSKE
ncbi:MAG: hypothetical protein ACKOYC_04080, partial [Bacteroidota bacterium]